MKVSRKVYFLVLIIEECAEIIHRTCKAIRFGLDERWKPEHKTNRELLQDELLDLSVVQQMNVQMGNINECPSFPELQQAVDKKRGRVDKYLVYSTNACKTVSEDEGCNPPLVFDVWKAENSKPKCRHGNDPASCSVCEDIRSGYVNTEG